MKTLLSITELGMLVYWGIAIMVAAGCLMIAPEYMYSGYENPLIVVWNWSFLPIDVLFAVCGLSARFLPMVDRQRQILEVIGLSLMFCAGLMALSFWTLQGWFDVVWWGMNGWLVALSSVQIICLLTARGKGQNA